MREHCIERRSLNGHGSLSWDLAHHMYARALCGKIALVTDKPKELLSITRKQWMRIYRQALREQASTLNTPRAVELVQIISRMQSMTFSARSPDDLLEADVTFATADDFVRIPPVCPTVYVTYKFEREKLHMLTSWMPKGGLVVIYD
ncbi:MAG TPA: hypothetical protein VJ836_06380 [Candidatus Saccharimonadales bacterium]|nr:hypothetical protein [Candidatus Saccharimonadales bacterium]